jgi:hypothetical protein
MPRKPSHNNQKNPVHIAVGTAVFVVVLSLITVTLYYYNYRQEQTNPDTSTSTNYAASSTSSTTPAIEGPVSATSTSTSTEDTLIEEETTTTPPPPDEKPTTEKPKIIVTPPEIEPSVIKQGPINPFGIAAGGDLTNLDTEGLARRLDAIEAMGVSWIRFDIDWNHVQHRGPDFYDWTDYDRIINEARARGLRVLGIISYTPQWDQREECVGNKHCSPKDPDLFAKFAAMAAERYKEKGVHHWEIWNEPNSINFWLPYADPNEYIRLLKESYVAIKRVDPDAVVITGGLAPQDNTGGSMSPTTFLENLYKAGAAEYFDAVGHHPYTFPYLPSSEYEHAWNQMFKTNPSLRSIMIKNGDEDKKIWLTEFGAPTGGPGGTARVGDSNFDNIWHVDEELQAVTVNDTMALYKTYNWVGPIFWYMDTDAGTSKSTNENFFGLIRYDGSKKPAYEAYRQIILSWK